jgi:sulfonate transport system substrate-binding protein
MRAITGLLSCAVLALWTGVASAEPIKITEGWVVPGNWASLWLQKKDLAKYYGKTYVLDPQHFRGTPPMVTALANNQIDIANLAYSTLGIAIENAGLSDLRVVADEFQDGVPGWYSQEFMVLKNGPVHTISDLKGKVVATNAQGSAVDVAMKIMLLKHGLKVDRDYTEIEAPFPAMVSMLQENKAALIPAVIPFSYNPALRKIARDLFTQKQAIGRTDMIIWVARKPWIDAHRVALIDFFEDTMRIERWYLDPKNHAAVMQIMAKITHRPANIFSYIFTHRDVYHDPDMMPDLTALQRNVDLTVELGFVKQKFSVENHADLSLIKEAAARFEGNQLTQLPTQAAHRLPDQIDNSGHH